MVARHYEAIAEQAYAANLVLDRFYAEEAKSEAEEIGKRLAAGDAAEVTVIADEFQGAATICPDIVAAWARKDTAEVLRLVDAALTNAIRDVAHFRAEKLNP